MNPQASSWQETNDTSTINLNGSEFRRSLNGTGVLRIFFRVNQNNIVKVTNRAGTWNVHSLKIAGKLVIVEKETKKYGLPIINISENSVEHEHPSSKENFVFLSGNDSHRNIMVIVDGRYIKFCSWDKSYKRQDNRGQIKNCLSYFECRSDLYSNKCSTT